MVDRSDAESRFRHLYENHYAVVLVTCRRRLGALQAGEDAAAEVFRIAWQKISAGATIDLPWLYSTARNVVGNEYRRSRRSRTLVDRVQGLAPEILGSDVDAALDTRAAFARLRDADRELLFMAFWEELSLTEMAAILRLKEPALRMRLSRARRAFRDALTPRPASRDEEVTSHG